MPIFRLLPMLGYPTKIRFRVFQPRLFSAPSTATAVFFEYRGWVTGERGNIHT